jgi:hypothetical protein
VDATPAPVAPNIRKRKGERILLHVPWFKLGGWIRTMR